jgi:hypothetical protein
MNFINNLTLVELTKTHAQSPLARRRSKLAEKVEQQVQLASNPEYKPTKVIWSKDNDGNEHLVERAMRIKRWWVEQMDGSVQLTVRYGSKALELAKGKNAIKLSSKAAIEGTLRNIKLAVLSGEFDDILQTQVGAQSPFGRKVKTK